MADTTIDKNGNGWSGKNRRSLTPIQVIGLIGGLLAIIATGAGLFGIAQAQEARMVTVEMKIDKSDEVNKIKLENIAAALGDLKTTMLDLSRKIDRHTQRDDQ